jgi:hypothetical protein
MAQSKVEICNRALALLGQSGVLSTGQEGQEARACELMYDPTVRALLEKGNWTFATRRAKLRMLDETPVFEFDYAFVLPGEYLKKQAVFFDGIEVRDTNRYSIEDGKLLTNYNGGVYMKFTYMLVDPKKFSELFAEAVARGIATRTSRDIVEAPATLIQELENNEKIAIREAMSFDSMNQSITTGFPAPVVAVKY